MDGLGHGPEAAADSALAAAALSKHPEFSPADALHLCDRALRGRRGAAISIATIDIARAHLEYAGIGNVEGRLLQSTRMERLISFRGIVGVAMRTIRPFSLTLEPSWLLALHTDGISQRFDMPPITAVTGSALDRAAQSIVDRWGRSHDDATLVLVTLDPPVH